MERRMHQLSFGDAEQQGKRKRTRREVFLAEMDRVVPWEELWDENRVSSYIVATAWSCRTALKPHKLFKINYLLVFQRKRR